MITTYTICFNIRKELRFAHRIYSYLFLSIGSQSKWWSFSLNLYLIFVIENQVQTECLNIVTMNFIYQIVNICNKLSISCRCEKVKTLKLSLSLIKHHDMTYGEWKYSSTILNLGREQTAATCSHWFLAPGFFYPEDGGNMFLRNVCSHKIYTAPHARKRHSLLVCSVCELWTQIRLQPLSPLYTVGLQPNCLTLILNLI
jgi:hypothetical protein